jgi:hypothetical protein
MEFYMNGIASRGVAVIPYRPEILAMYRGFGHLPVTRTAYFEYNAAESFNDSGVVPLDRVRDESAILTCYTRLANRYSGIIRRSLPDMRLKLADYATDGGKLIGIRENGEISGYCAYEPGDEPNAMELIGGEAEQARLVRALAAQSPSGKATGKLPPDCSLTLPGLTLDVRPMNVMGVADVSALLSVIGLHEFRAEIIDKTVPANNGVFDFAGRRTEDAPHLRISAGHLAQLVTGYASLEELIGEGNAEVLDVGACREIDKALPKQECYSLDEYCPGDKPPPPAGGTSFQKEVRFSTKDPLSKGGVRRSLTGVCSTG